MERIERRLVFAWWALRLGLGAGLLVAGVDKFFDKLATWSMYLSPLAERLLPVSGEAFMRGAGVLEALLGLAILTRWTRLGGYLAALWLLSIVANLAAAGTYWDLCMRDFELSLAAFTLARLTAWREALAAEDAAARNRVAGTATQTSWADLPPGTRSTT